MARLIAWCLIGILRVAWFLVRSPRDSWHAIREARRTLRTYSGECSVPLTPLSEGLFRLEHGDPLRAQDGPTVIYFTGTGETPHAPLLALNRLLDGSRAAAAARFVVEAPSGRGAYYGSSAFSARIWQRVEELVRSLPGPFVLVGFSRGALAALDVAARITEEQGKVASVLSFSPPLDTPRTWPPSIVSISRFERVLEHLEQALTGLPAALTRCADFCIERIHLVFTARIELEHDMHEADGLLLAYHDIHQQGAMAAGKRATREFRLLVEAHRRELELFARGVAGVAARTERFFALLCWGEDDPWAPARASRARMEAALQREGATLDRVELTMFPGRGHALFREIHQPLAPMCALVDRVLAEAAARQKKAEEKKQKAENFERHLRQSAFPEPSHD